MLAQTMIDQLNAQINVEFFSSNLYLQMSAWCEDKGFEGAAKFMRAHAEEEMQHMHRLFTYVSETGGMPLLGAIEAPQSQFDSLLALFEYTYEHEQMITSKINALAHTAFTNQDYSTFNFLQWYVSEQHEEEKLFKSIVDKIRLVGEDGKALFFVDKDLAQMAQQESASVMTVGE
ncbi:non-heme ferritin [Shewanella loihica]|uniref:Ferritin n=1 Tax=Shewanella loihica (strain ATCC BAA-1088 / PV-4) TaxID=323850 RepID=A3Q8W7_SHELP|nr:MULTISPECIES: non-heme ferritin [Shewanella]ABO21915.1 Ferritin, Dps family protein [Shewanella loihica PV-4]QYJ82506.1 non-heme ferritin [Shewanella aegiceratis]QYJ90081.1 non-heme ferritin [Shewanella halotolerans]QYJ93873.1 non-heme ferritin [Shewanella spartinae]QYJ97727.1 non-heme ferritin [Shewanella alkalitolerans]